MLSIVIPTCNRNVLLSKCLDRLHPAVQGIDSQDYEVIVTDDSLYGKARLLIEHNYSWVKWVGGPQKGPAANRNYGAKQANGDWLVFIDDDCLADKDLLKNYMKAFALYPDRSVFEGAIHPDDWSLLRKDLAECPINIHGNCFWSANICIKKSLFQKIGGFDESYLIAAQEDQQLKIDIVKSTGQDIKFLKQCVVIHPVRFTNMMNLIKRIPLRSKNYSMYVVKNMGGWKISTALKFGISQYAFHLRRIFRFLKAGKMKSIIVSMAWLTYGVPLNIVNVYLLRRKY